MKVPAVDQRELALCQVLGLALRGGHGDDFGAEGDPRAQIGLKHHDGPSPRLCLHERKKQKVPAVASDSSPRLLYEVCFEDEC